MSIIDVYTMRKKNYECPLVMGNGAPIPGSRDGAKAGTPLEESLAKV